MFTRQIISSISTDLYRGGLRGDGVVEDDEDGGRGEDGDDVCQHDLALDVLQLGHGGVDVEGDGEEEEADEAAHRVDHSHALVQRLLKRKG